MADVQFHFSTGDAVLFISAWRREWLRPVLAKTMVFQFRTIITSDISIKNFTRQPVQRLPLRIILIYKVYHPSSYAQL